MSALRMAYAGQRLTAKDTLAHAWHEVDADGEPGELRLYKKPLVRYAAIGAVYEFTEADGGASIYTGGEKGPRRLDGRVDDDLRLSWEAQDMDARVQHEQQRIEKRDKDVSLIRDALLPLRVAMARRRGAASTYAFGVAVSAELHRPLTKAEREEAGL